MFYCGMADRVFSRHGEEFYRRFQREHKDDVMVGGVVFPLID